ncbi:hypothetical protein [Bremerella cremea]|uniref:hypothetical protein n=1 Tax=Bremerella cremea TaxID=1031537 RepID=UPI0011C01E71|nr:hypothetical protein [Bremerella cremea]
MIQASFKNGVLCLIVLLVGYIHANQVLPYGYGYFSVEMIVFFQPILVGLWLAGGAAPWWVRAVVFLAAYPYFRLVIHFNRHIEAEFLGLACLQMVASAFAFRGVCYVCRQWLQRKVARQQFSMRGMMLLVSFAFAACVVWGNNLVNFIQKGAEDVAWQFLVLLSVCICIMMLAALPALFRTRAYRKWAMVIVCVIIGAIPSGVFGIIYLIEGSLYDLEDVFSVNIQTWLVAFITAATIYPLQAITKRDGTPFYPVFTPVDVPLEAVSPTSPTEVEFSEGLAAPDKAL